MRILAAAMHPGTAEAMAPVVSNLRDAGHTVKLIGVRNDTPETRNHGGSALLFEQMGVEHSELQTDGCHGDVTRVSLDYASSLFERFTPDRVLVGCSVDRSGEIMCIEDAVIWAASRRQIPSVHVVGGWDVWYPRIAGALASRWAVFDEAVAEEMVQRGAPRSKIEITGNPALDAYSTPDLSRRQDVRDRLAIGDERLIAYFGQARTPGSIPDNPRTLRWVVDALGPEDRLIFARHPRDDRDYGDLLTHPDRRLLAVDLPTDQLVYGIDVAVSHFSTMSLKAALLSIPTILVLVDSDIPDRRKECGGYPLSNIGGAYEVNAEPQLTDLLQQKLSGKASTLRAAVNVDGRATERVAGLVLHQGAA